MMEMMEQPNFIDHPPPSYEQEMNKPQLIRPPSYREAIIKNESTPNVGDIITTQPEDSSWLQNINIVGVSKGEGFSAEKNIPYFNVFSNNYLAFNHVAFNCCSCSADDNFTIIDARNYTANNVLFSYKSKPSIKSISLHPNNKSVAMVLSENKNNELALFSTSYAEANTSPTSNFLYNKININIPTDKPYSTYYDNNDNLYLVGLKNQQLFLWATKFILEEQNANWQELIYLDTDSNAEASFSNDGAFLFILQSDKTLKIFSRDYSWSQIKTIPNIESFPADIDSTAEFMVFVNKEIVQIHGVSTDINFVVTDNNSITAACFIPDTKDLLLFDSSNTKVVLLKYHNNDWVIDNSKSIKLGVVVKQAYFNPNDKTQLIVLFVNYNKGSQKVFSSCEKNILLSCVFGGPFGGFLKTAFSNNFEKTMCKSLCWKNMGIGLGVGIGALCGMLCLFLVKEEINNTVKANEIDTKLKRLKHPNSNEIERF